MSLELRRVRLQSLARILSNNGKISLIFADICATDFKTIMIRPHNKSIIDKIPASLAECWIVEKAICAHEAGHIRLTSKKVWEKAVKVDGLMKHILNIVEDSRVERCMANIYPGTAQWFQFSNQYIFDNRNDWGGFPDLILSGLINYALLGKLSPKIESHEETVNIIRQCSKYIDLGRLEKNTDGAYEYAKIIYDLIKDYFPDKGGLPEIEMPGTLKPEEFTGEGGIDPRGIPVLAPSSGKPSGKDDKSDKDKSKGFSELLTSAEEELSSMERESKELEKKKGEVGDIDDTEKTTKELSKDIHEGIVFKIKKVKDRDINEYNKEHTEVKPYITSTVNEIRRILEYKPSMRERNLRKGRLDSGSLWKTRVYDPKLFAKNSLPQDNSKLAVYLLVDCSGSMGSIKMAQARKAAILLYEVCSALKIPVNVTGFTGSMEAAEDVVHIRCVDFIDKAENKYNLSSLRAQCENRDGYSIKVATREILQQNETQKVIIVLSDGMPCMPYKGYTCKAGIIDTARSVREAEKEQVGIIGLYFGPETYLPGAQRIYNNLIYVKNIQTLPQTISRVLKKVISKL